MFAISNQQLYLFRALWEGWVRDKENETSVGLRDKARAGVRDEEGKMSGGLGDKARVGMRDEDEEVSGDLGDEKDEGIARWGRRGGGRGERRGQIREEEDEACIGLGDKVSAGQGMGLGGRDECLLGTRRGLGCFLGRHCVRGGVLDRHRERGDVLGPAWRTRRRCPWPVS